MAVSWTNLQEQSRYMDSPKAWDSELYIYETTLDAMQEETERARQSYVHR